MSEAARASGLNPDVVFDRVNKLGWSESKALTTPKRAACKYGAQMIEGIPKTVWAKQQGINLSAAYRTAKQTGQPVVLVIENMGRNKHA